MRAWLTREGALDVLVGRAESVIGMCGGWRGRGGEEGGREGTVGMRIAKTFFSGSSGSISTGLGLRLTLDRRYERILAAGEVNCVEERLRLRRKDIRWNGSSSFQHRAGPAGPSGSPEPSTPS